MNRLGRQLVVGLCAALIALGCYTTSGPRSVALAAGSPNISLAESAPGTVLYGASSTVTLTVTNPAGGSWAYNLSYEDVLPSGVSYVAGSASLGNPAILSNQPSANKTTLIWSNVSDLSPGSVATLTFKVIAATDTGPAPFLLANNTYTDNSSAYVNTDPRQVPQFSATGTVSNFTGSASASGTTALAALQISLSPGGVLLRGVHDHQAVYSVTITNNQVHATNGIGATVYLPAGLEDLFCGQTDNTTGAPTNPGSTQEYPGSGPLSGHTGIPANCVPPTSVTTVNLDPDGAGPLAGCRLHGGAVERNRQPRSRREHHHPFRGGDPDPGEHHDVDRDDADRGFRWPGSEPRQQQRVRNPGRHRAHQLRRCDWNVLRNAR